MKEHAIIGFNHGVLGLAENPALGPGFVLFPSKHLGLRPRWFDSKSQSLVLGFQPSPAPHD